MRSAAKSGLLEERSLPADHELRFLVELPPWHQVFLNNLLDLFRPEPPQAWMTAAPGVYWPDAMVNRPPAWNCLRVSFLGHILVALAILWLNLLWLDRPRVIPEEIPHTTIMHYQVSEYLPSVATKTNAVPAPRRYAQKADP